MTSRLPLASWAITRWRRQKWICRGWIWRRVRGACLHELLAVVALFMRIALLSLVSRAMFWRAMLPARPVTPASPIDEKLHEAPAALSRPLHAS